MVEQTKEEALRDVIRSVTREGEREACAGLAERMGLGGEWVYCKNNTKWRWGKGKPRRITHSTLKDAMKSMAEEIAAAIRAGQY